MIRFTPDFRVSSPKLINSPQPQLQARNPQVRQHLFLVNRSELLDGLQLDEDQVVHDQIGAETNVEMQVIPHQRDGLFLSDDQPLFRQLVGEDRLVNRFEESRPQPPVNIDGDLENRPAQFIVRHSKVL